MGSPARSMEVQEGGFGMAGLLSALLQPRIIVSFFTGIFFICLPCGVVPESQKRNSAFRGQRRRRVSIRRALGWVIRALWRRLGCARPWMRLLRPLQFLVNPQIPMEGGFRAVGLLGARQLRIIVRIACVLLTIIPILPLQFLVNPQIPMEGGFRAVGLLGARQLRTIVPIACVLTLIWVLDGAFGESPRSISAPWGHRPRIITKSYLWIKGALGWLIGAFWTLRELHSPLVATATIPPAAQLEFQQPASEENLAVGIPQERFQLIIWNEGSLQLALLNMKVCYKQINYPIQFGLNQLPYASNGSSPSHYEYSYVGAPGNEENNEQHLQYKPFSLLDHGDVKLIDPTSLSQLKHMVHQCQIVEPGHQELGSFLCEFFNSSGLCIDTKTCMDASKFTCQSTKRCVMILKITTGLLCVMWKELTEPKCQSSYQDLKEYSFAVSARRPIENLIEAAHSISNVKWPASHIYQMLVLYEAIYDILPAIQKLHSGSSQVLIICPNESDIIYQQMRVNFRGIFDGIECFIRDNLNGSRSGATYDIHPVTNFLARSMELFKNHSSVVKRISCADDGSNLLGHLLFKVINYWVQELKEHSKLYTGGRNYAFLLNDLTYFAEETRTLLQVLLPNSEHDEMLEVLDLLIMNYTSRYLEEFWGPVLACLGSNSRKKPNRSSLDKFTSKFKKTCDCQRTWVLHTQLKMDLRKEIRDFIIPSYEEFLRKLRISRLEYVRRFLSRKQEARWYRTPEEMENTVKELERDVDELFES